MEDNVAENKGYVNVTFDEDSRSAVNSLILDYYQKFGRKRDLEQFFSLSTAQSDISDPTSLFWRKMKVQSDSSDSGDGKAGSSTELCRISIKCSLPDHSSSQDENQKYKDDSVSPPIITEEATSPLPTDQGSQTHSDNEFVKSDDNNSQKSIEPQETSVNKPFSPTSSITSQRKLEWDSLGDVGYGNESQRKASGSSLSTLERLALHQQYSNNDTMHDTKFGPPTSHSTPIETNISHKEKKGMNVKKTTIYKKDVDCLEVNVPHTSENTGAINVNMTKHISFNVDKDGDVTIGSSKENVEILPDKVSVETAITPQIRKDKEIQTTLSRNNTCKVNTVEMRRNQRVCDQRFPIILSLNTLKKRKRRKKFKMFRKNFISRSNKKNNMSRIPLEKSADQISAAESFEYMPGHIYRQNQVKNNNVKDSNSVGNKSSLESSIILTTDSSKASIHSFSQDLEKSINLLNEALQPKYKDSNLKEKLIKEVVQRLLKTRYSDDDSGTVFLSGLSFNNKNLGLHKSNQTTTSTSDGNNIDDTKVVKKPKKSILRVDKFNPNGMASTSQSTPNLCTSAQNEKPVSNTPTFSNTESDFSSRERNSSDTVPKMSSEELYKKYLEALKREQIHKKVLKDKEILLKKKLVSSDTCIKVMPEPREKSYDRLYKLIKELAHNNLNNGSGDANKFELVSNSKTDQNNYLKGQRSHSVFTVTSGKNPRCAKRVKQSNKDERDTSEAGCSGIKNNCSRYHHHTENARVSSCPLQKVKSKSCGEESISDDDFRRNNEDNTDLAKFKCQSQYVKSGKTSPIPTDRLILDDTKDIKYVCLCAKDAMVAQDVPEKFLIYKCLRPGQQNTYIDTTSKVSISVGTQCSTDCVCTKHTCLGNTQKIVKPITPHHETICLNKGLQFTQSSCSGLYPTRKASTSSQTNGNLDVLLNSELSDRNKPPNTTHEKHKSRNTIKENLRGENKPTSNLQREVTQSIQTEITIDPKILEPTLSDVIFINDLNSKQLISDKKYRHDTKNIPNMQESQISNECSHVHEDQGNKDNDHNFLSNMNSAVIPCLFSKTDLKSSTSKEDRFSIPIHGTYMTLVVRLGTSTANVSDLNENGDVSKNCLTEEQCQPPCRENLLEDHSKGVQCTSTDIFTQIDNQTRRVTESEENLCNRFYPKVNNIQECLKPQFKEISSVNDCVIGDVTKYNTYPKKTPIAKKPFVRANTDTICLERPTTNIHNNIKVNVETQKDSAYELQQKDTIVLATSNRSSNDNITCEKSKDSDNSKQCSSKKSNIGSNCDSDNEILKDPILSIIQDVTKRYTKKDMDKSKRKKCFKEIITVLNYLLDTEENADQKQGCSSSSNEGVPTIDQLHEKDSPKCTIKKMYVDKGVQLSMKRNKKENSCTESSDRPTSSEIPTTTTDSAACKVLDKIKRECEKYHHKRCKTHSGQKKREESSSTSVNCDNCNRAHYCPCRARCKGHKTKASVEKIKKKGVAYNLIIQTSDSIASEENVRNDCCRQIKNVIVKVPSKIKQDTNAPFKEVSAKIEKNMPHCNSRSSKIQRSHSMPNDSEMSSDFRKNIHATCTIRDYLEMNRPDFIDKTTKRQDCLKIINETRSNERASKRRLLSQQLERQQKINALSSDDIKHLAKELGDQLRRKKVAPKFISEREMKKHSEKIYKTLPEVVQKKEELKKENIKKTNLLMANIFKKNLQKKTLRGSINLSNYSTVVKI